MCCINAAENRTLESSLLDFFLLNIFFCRRERSTSYQTPQTLSSSWVSIHWNHWNKIPRLIPWPLWSVTKQTFLRAQAQYWRDHVQSLPPISELSKNFFCCTPRHKFTHPTLQIRRMSMTTLNVRSIGLIFKIPVKVESIRTQHRFLLPKVYIVPNSGRVHTVFWYSLFLATSTSSDQKSNAQLSITQHNRKCGMDKLYFHVWLWITLGRVDKRTPQRPYL